MTAIMDPDLFRPLPGPPNPASIQPMPDPYRHTDQAPHVGVIVGRFQTPYLHEGHKALIDTVLSRHERVVIYVGVAPLPSTSRNPLNFSYRESMIYDTYEHAKFRIDVRPISDRRVDADWSADLDADLEVWKTQNRVPAATTFTLYGSRDSFLKVYVGTHPTEEVITYTDAPTATDIRQAIAQAKHGHVLNDNFGAGAVWAAGQRFPTVYSTVDAIIWNLVEETFLLGRKPRSKEWCLIGGFADPASSCDEEDVLREVREETGLNCSIIRYLGNFTIDDWRYRSELDTVRTRLYVVTPYAHQGPAAPADDIEEVGWFTADHVPTILQECHLPLWNAFRVAYNVPDVQG